MTFKLFQKLGSLEGKELWMLLIAVLTFCCLLFFVCRKPVEEKQKIRRKGFDTAALVRGALCLSLSFALSYFKLFSLPFGGSITLCSMLPLVMYASLYGPVCGFTAAFCYAVLQIIQGAWIVHWAQFLLDYFVAFTLLGTASLLPGRLTGGMLLSGTARMCASIVSGAIFFSDGGLAYGIANPWVYSAIYGLLTIGADTLLCTVVSVLPPIRRLYRQLSPLNG